MKQPTDGTSTRSHRGVQLSARQGCAARIAAQAQRDSQLLFAGMFGCRVGPAKREPVRPPLAVKA